MYLSSRVDRRTDTIAEIARTLPQLNGRLARQLWRRAGGRLSRGMASVLATLADGELPLGRLAEIEGVAQPTMTRIVERLEAEHLVRRERSAADGRVVVVSVTPAGNRELATLRACYTAMLEERLAGLPDARLRDLLSASEVLQMLIDALRDGPGSQPQHPDVPRSPRVR